MSEKRFVLLRPIANGEAFPSGILDQKTGQSAHENPHDYMRMIEGLEADLEAAEKARDVEQRKAVAAFTGMEQAMADRDALRARLENLMPCRTKIIHTLAGSTEFCLEGSEDWIEVYRARDVRKALAAEGGANG